MPLISPPITNIVEEDSWKNQATELIRLLESLSESYQRKLIELESRIKALE